MAKVGLTIYFFLITCVVYGQDNITSKRTFFTAKAIDNEDNSIFIPFAHVFNESLRSSSISDTSGILKIRANLNDTLVITAIGYYPKVFVVSEQQISHTNPVNVILERRTYAIQEVSVHALGTYQQFKKKVENLDLPYTKTEKLKSELKEISIEVGIEAFEKARHEPMLATTPLPKIGPTKFYVLSRKEKLLKKEERKAIIYAKFNKIVINEFTELKEPELTDFFVFCDFNEEFLFKATEYEVGEAIKNKFAIYLAMKEETNETNDTLSD